MKEEALDHLKEAFDLEKFQVVDEGVDFLHVHRMGPATGAIAQRSMWVHALLRPEGEGTRVRLTVEPEGWGLSKRDSPVLAWYLEGLRDFLRDREDLSFREGVVGTNGASMRAADGKTLVPASLEFTNEAMRFSEWYVGPLRWVAFIGLGIAVALTRVTRNPILLGGVLIGSLLSFVVPWAYSRRHPSRLRLTRTGIVLLRGKPQKEILWEDLEGLVSVDPSSTDVYLAVREEKPRIRLSQMCSWQLQEIMNVRASAKQAKEWTWLFPQWRAIRRGMRAKLPNRIPSLDESRVLKVRRYFLNDPKKTLVAVSEAADKKALMRAAKKRWDDPKLVREFMKDASLEGYHDAAGVLAGRLMKLEPGDDEGFRVRFGALMELKKLDEAEALVETQLQAHPESSNAHLARSAVLKERGRIEDALYEVGQAVELDGNNVDALRLWAGIVSDEGGTAQAISELDYVAHAHPENWAPHYVLGELMTTKQAMDDAEKYLQKSLEVKATDEALGLLSAIYGNAQRHEDLVTLVEGARKERTVGPAPLLNLFSAYVELGRIGEAKRCLKSLKQVEQKEWLPAIAEAEARIAR